MSVLIEAISVVIRADRLGEVVEWSDFKEMVPNRTLCADGELVRVGFMHPDDVEDFVGQIEALGLRYMVDGVAADLAVVDQKIGPVVPTPWLEFGNAPTDSGKASAARLKGGEATQFLTPDGWTYKGSLSEKFTLIPNEHANTIETEQFASNVETVRSKLLKGLRFIGRTKGR